MNTGEDNLIMYRSPEWALMLELYLAVQAVAMGIAGSVNSNSLGVTLFVFREGHLWTFLFCGIGLGLVATTLLEIRSRKRGWREDCIRRFAFVREKLNLFLIPAWMFAIVVFFLSDQTESVSALFAVPALCFAAFIHRENVRAQHKKSVDRRCDGPGDSVSDCRQSS